MPRKKKPAPLVETRSGKQTFANADYPETFTCAGPCGETKSTNSFPTEGAGAPLHRVPQVPSAAHRHAGQARGEDHEEGATK